MTRTVDQRLERAKRISRRITTEEQIERGEAALDNAGLLEAAEEWAETQMVTVEEIALSLSSFGRYSVTSFANPKDIETKNEDRLICLQDKLEQIHELITEQQSSSLSKDWYSVNEVAKLTGFKPYTIRQLCNTGRLKESWNKKHYRTGEWRISRNAVEWIQNHGLPPTA